jgi:hypothetical protein
MLNEEGRLLPVLCYSDTIPEVQSVVRAIAVKNKQSPISPGVANMPQLCVADYYCIVRCSLRTT